MNVVRETNDGQKEREKSSRKVCKITQRVCIQSFNLPASKFFALRKTRDQS